MALDKNKMVLNYSKKKETYNVYDIVFMITKKNRVVDFILLPLNYLIPSSFLHKFTITCAISARVIVFSGSKVFSLVPFISPAL